MRFVFLGSVCHEVFIPNGRSGTATSSPELQMPSPINKVFDTLWYMKKEAYATSTIEAVGKRLQHLKRNSNLENPENVKIYIAQKTCSPAFKESLIEAYALYCKAHNIKWNQPFYNRYDKQPKIPTEERLNQIIANSSKRLSLALSIIRDLGLRPIELTWLKLKT